MPSLRRQKLVRKKGGRIDRLFYCKTSTRYSLHPVGEAPPPLLRQEGSWWF